MPENDTLTETPQSFASVIPLNYDPDRTEHTVIFCSTNWEELVDLLEDPVAFFIKKQSEFSNPETDKQPWYLRRPVTAIVQPGGRRKPNSKRLLAMFQNKNAANQTKEAEKSDEQRAMNRAFETGAFFAEFAICTGILIVHYWPPLKRAEPRFKHPFTPATFGLVKGPNNKPIGTLHFDIEKPLDGKLSKRDHAELAVDCLESRSRIMRAGLNRNKHLFEQGVADLRTSEEKVVVPDQPDSVETTTNEQKTRFTLKERGQFFKFPDGRSDQPTIVMDGLSPEFEEGILCCNARVRIEGNEIHVDDTMIFKMYVSQAEKDKDCPPPTPISGGSGS